MIVGIDHVQLAMPAGREEDARGFYSGVLGIPEVPKPAELALRGGAWFESARVRVHLGVDPVFTAARKAHAGLLVDDLGELVDVLQRAGCEVVEDADPGRVYTFDPFGNRLELIQRR